MTPNPICSGCMCEDTSGTDQCAACVTSRLSGKGSLFIGRYSPDPARGAKHDAGKTRAGLMVEDFAKALAAVAHVSTMGAAKYTARSWKTVPDARDRYYDAFHRHILAAAAGEVNDPESGLPHQAHVAWNALALLELQLTEAKK